MTEEVILKVIGKASVSAFAYLAKAVVSFELELAELRSMFYLIYRQAQDNFKPAGFPDKPTATAAFKTYLIKCLRNETYRILSESRNENSRFVRGMNLDEMKDPCSGEELTYDMLAEELTSTLNSRDAMIASELLSPSKAIIGAATRRKRSMAKRGDNSTELGEITHAICQVHGLTWNQVDYSIRKIQGRANFILDRK